VSVLADRTQQGKPAAAVESAAFIAWEVAMKSGWSALSSLGPPLIGLIGVTLGILLGNWLNQKSEARKGEREERTRR
jgi:hypothetical protein